MSGPGARGEGLGSRDESLRKIEGFIARVLFWGGLTSILIAASGLSLFIAKGGLGAVAIQDRLRSQTGSDPLVYTTLSQLFASLSISNPLAVTVLGLLILLLIPVISVTLLIFAFLRQRDYCYSIIAGLVLLILGLSTAFGGH